MDSVSPNKQIFLPEKYTVQLDTRMHLGTTFKTRLHFPGLALGLLPGFFVSSGHVAAALISLTAFRCLINPASPALLQASLISVHSFASCFCLGTHVVSWGGEACWGFTHHSCCTKLSMGGGTSLSGQIRKSAPQKDQQANSSSVGFPTCHETKSYTFYIIKKAGARLMWSKSP